MTPLPSRAYLAECFDYDAETGILRWRHRPREHFKSFAAYARANKAYPGMVAGCRRERGYIGLKVNDKFLYAHRVIWKLLTGEEPDEIDHKNHDCADNRQENLRAASRTQNVWNSSGWFRRKHSDAAKGIRRRGKVWHARIGIAGKERHLGAFDSESAASAAYCGAAAELHGEFSYPGLVEIGGVE